MQDARDVRATDIPAISPSRRHPAGRPL